MYNEAEQQGLAGFELLVMAFCHNMSSYKMSVQMPDDDDGISPPPWDMTIEQACRGCVMSAMTGDVERCKAYLDPVIKALAPASHHIIESIYKNYKKETTNETECTNGNHDRYRACSLGWVQCISTREIHGGPNIR